jgi:hypothetical protein
MLRVLFNDTLGGDSSMLHRDDDYRDLVPGQSNSLKRMLSQWPNQIKATVLVDRQGRRQLLRNWLGVSKIQTLGPDSDAGGYGYVRVDEL